MGVPLWVTNLPWNYIKAASLEHGLDWKLVGAIVQSESGGEPWAIRYESTFKYRHFFREHASNLGITVDTESMLQSTSFGLLQIMGCVARERGFEDYLPKLCMPEVGLKYGCLHIKKLYERYSKDSDIIAAYNAGSVIEKISGGGVLINELYVDKTMRYRRALNKLDYLK